MNTDKIKWLERIFDGLTAAGACMDSMPLEVAGPEDEALEAVKADIDRAWSAVRRLLALSNKTIYTQWSGRVETPSRDDGMDIIPF